jgi:diadenosine tetraphosphate (Ap4A) HIT family hydrolase
MPRSRPLLLIASAAVCLLGWAPRGAADVRGCHCDVHDAVSMQQRECSLCAEAERHADGPEFFTIRDANPIKPNRWLILPKSHTAGSHALHLLPADVRTRLWTYAIEQAKAHFGEREWGVAYNGDTVRTQCHLHIHAGRFIPAAENSKFRVYRRIADFPAPSEGGILIHPVPGGYHVHTGEAIMETALVR